MSLRAKQQVHDEDDDDDSKKRFFPPDSIRSENILLDFFEKVLFICKRKILSELIKERNNSFGQTQFGPKASLPPPCYVKMFPPKPVYGQNQVPFC
jgi:hypothetical protein